jgi:hypothetical protein
LRERERKGKERKEERKEGRKEGKKKTDIPLRIFWKKLALSIP